MCQLLALEPALSRALEQEVEQQRVLTMGKLEEMLGSALDRIIRDDLRSLRPKVVTRVVVQSDEDHDDQTTETAREGTTRASRAKSGTSSGEDDMDSAPDPASDRAKPAVRTKRVEREVALSVRFVSLPDSDTNTRRAQLIGGTMEINTAHPDFRSRIKMNRGRPKFTDRLGSYLAVRFV